MLKAGIIFGIITLVLAFLAGLLDMFPSDIIPDSGTASSSVSEEASGSELDVADDVGNQLTGLYEGLVSDVTSYKDDRSTVRVDSRKTAMRDTAEKIQESTQGFSERLRSRLDDLKAQIQDIVSEARDWLGNLDLGSLVGGNNAAFQ